MDCCLFNCGGDLHFFVLENTCERFNRTILIKENPIKIKYIYKKFSEF